MTRLFWTFPSLAICVVTLLSQTVSVFIRERPGLRSYSVGQLLSLSVAVMLLPHALAFAHMLLLYFVPVLMFVPLPGLDINVSPVFTLYLLFVPVVAFWQRTRELARLRRGETLHSYCRGISRLEFLARWSPRITLGHVYCYIEPGAVVLAGALTYCFVSAALGGWWMAAGLALAVREQTNAMRELDGVLDTIDGLLEARQRAHLDALITGQPGLALGALSLAQSGGIATGIATELVPAVQALRLQSAAPFAAAPVVIRGAIDAG